MEILRKKWEFANGRFAERLSVSAKGMDSLFSYPTHRIHLIYPISPD